MLKEKYSLSCLCVRAIEYTKFKIFIFTLLIGIFSYINLVNFFVFKLRVTVFHATGHSFSPRDVIFGFRRPFIIRREIFFKYSISLFIDKGVNFSFF